MIVELSPSVYLALCGLVKDALQFPSDATHLLKRCEQELASASSPANDVSDNDMSDVSDEFSDDFEVAAANG